MRGEGKRDKEGERDCKRWMESGTESERSREMGWVTGERRRERGKKGRQWLRNKRREVVGAEKEMEEVRTDVFKSC